jgi:hypothetical protein
MIERKFVVALAVATIGLNLIVAGGVAAKASHCRKDCKPDISRCLAGVPTSKSCTGTAAEKKACRKMLAGQRKTCHGLVTRCKQQNPSMSGTCLPSSTTTTSGEGGSTATSSTVSSGQGGISGVGGAVDGSGGSVARILGVRP